MNRVLNIVSTMGCSNHFPKQKHVKVAVLGAAGGIGQPLALLLKKTSGISSLCLYDVSTAVKGVAADLSHIDTAVEIRTFVGPAELPAALAKAHIVVIPAGIPRKPGMTRDDLFNINASIVCTLVAAAAKSCPNAFILIVTNPVNSTVPIAAEIMKRLNAFNPAKLLGVTSLDVVRSNTFISAKLCVSPDSINVPVIGGHAGITIVPLISQVRGSENLSQEDIHALTKRIMFGGDEVVNAKEGKGSATLSMAHAAVKLVAAIIRALNGETVTECAFVSSNVVEGLPFFSSPVQINANGISAIPPLPPLSAFEQELVKAAKDELLQSVQKGVTYGQKFKLL